MRAWVEECAGQPAPPTRLLSPLSARPLSARPLSPPFFPPFLPPPYAWRATWIIFCSALGFLAIAGAAKASVPLPLPMRT